MPVDGDWDFQLLDDLVQQRGDEVIHEIAIACPCRIEDTYASGIKIDGRPARVRSLSCPQCHGDGFIYRDAQCITGLITGIMPGNRSLNEMGYASPGDATFSPSLESRPVEDFDKITMLTSNALNEGQVIVRNAANLSDNQMLKTDLAENEDRLWYHADCSIWCEDSAGVIYQEGSDFELDGHIIRWIGSRPDEAQAYVLKYTAFLEWLAYAGPMERYDRHRGLGQRVQLRKKHVYFLGSSDKDTVEKRQEVEREFTTRTKI